MRFRLATDKLSRASSVTDVSMRVKIPERKFREGKETAAILRRMICPAEVSCGRLRLSNGPLNDTVMPSLAVSSGREARIR